MRFFAKKTNLQNIYIFYYGNKYTSTWTKSKESVF